jgi:hypothetical protein
MRVAKPCGDAANPVKIHEPIHMSMAMSSKDIFKDPAHPVATKPQVSTSTTPSMANTPEDAADLVSFDGFMFFTCRLHCQALRDAFPALWAERMQSVQMKP